MVHSEIASRLVDAAPGAVESHDPVLVEGQQARLTLRPRDGDELSRCLGALDGLGASALVRGGGSRLGAANPPRAIAAVLSTEALADIETFDAEDGVVHVGAGTTIAALRAHVAQEGWELPLDAWGPAATVGGVLSAAAFGPRLLALGPPRDAVLGLEVVLASGERTRCGGRVVKNVTGYDMAKLYTGAHGTLGVIERAWLRLRPAPERRLCLLGSVEGLEAAQSLGLAVARRPGVRCAALLAPRAAASVVGGSEPAGGVHHLVVELAGDGPVVDEDASWLAERLTSVPADEDVMARLAALEAGSRAPLRGRIAVLPSAVVAVARALGDALLSFHPGTGLLYAGTIVSEPAEASRPDPDPAEAARSADAIAAAASSAGAGVVFDALPLASRHERDVFGPPTPAASRLMADLKARFDPRGTLNPGRFQGRL